MDNKLRSSIAELQEQLRRGKISRRDFLRYASVLGLSVGAAEALAACAPQATATPVPTKAAASEQVAPTQVPTAAPVTAPVSTAATMEKDWQIMVDYDRCSGCRTCEFECSKAHYGLPWPDASRIKIHRFYPGVDIAMYCRNCSDAPCMESCPTDPKALSRDENTGALKVNKDVCIGCTKCTDACRSQQVRFHPTDNIPLMCDLCDLHPACVENCPEKALYVAPLSTPTENWAEPVEVIVKQRFEKLELLQYLPKEA